MTKRLADVAQGRGQRGDGQPRPEREARRVRADPPGGPDGARRPGLRATDQAARRARPPRRAGPARAAEPDLPGLRRGRRGRASRSRATRRSCAPRPSAACRRRTTSTSSSSSRSRASSSPAACTRRPTRRTATTAGSPSADLPTVLVNAGIDGLGFPRVSCDDAVAVEQAMGHLISLGPHADRAAARAGGPHPLAAQARARAGARAKRRARRCRTTSPTRCTRSRRPRPRDPAARPRHHRGSCAPATRWRWARSGRRGGPA